MFIDGITVCVNYADYLDTVVPFNRPFFDRWTIITTEEDKDTVKLCQKYNLNVVFTTRLYESGPFCKGKAINDGLISIKPKDWICHIDADTLISAKPLRQFVDKSNLDMDYFYSVMGRVLVEDDKALDEFLERKFINKSEIEHYGLFAGFFQMWHSSVRSIYPEESHNAGLDDILMRDSFDKTQLKMFPYYAIHIGPMWKNHNGRTDYIAS